MTEPVAAKGATLKKQHWSAENLPKQLEAFIAAQTGRRVAVRELRRFTAGLSWVTFGFTAAVQGEAGAQVLDLIVRIGDPNGLLAPYTARPEYLLLTALADRPGLPLPRAHWYSDDAAVLGAPFLITGRVAGDTPLPPWGGGAEVAALQRAENTPLAEDFADGLAAIHSFDWRGTPLAGLDPSVSATNATQREIERWLARIEGKGDRAANAALHYAARWLEAHAPVAPRVCVVHGDYRVGNFLQQDGRITAILDWELAHLGDPHEDLAWAGTRTWGGSATRIGGLFDRQDFYRRYEEKTGFKIDLAAVRYHEVLTQLKIATMLVGAMRHVEEGRAQDVRLVSMGFQLAPTLMGLFSMIKAIS